jgi:hypothetical protein
VRKKLRINDRHDVPSGWDHFFSQGTCACVRVTMKDESQILGYYGANSFAAYSKDGGDLFLEAVYVPDEEGWFGPAVPGSLGVWVKASDAVFMEAYAPGDELQKQSD